VLSCPGCGSTKTWKDGLRYNHSGDPTQRWLCRSCGYRFSESKVKVNVSSQSLEGLNSESNLFDTNVAKGDFPIKQGFDPLSFQRREDVASHVSSRGTVAEKSLNTFGDYNRNRRVCASEAKAAKNLVEVETRQKQPAGGTEIDEASVKGKIVEFLWYMKKENYAESTIQRYVKEIERLAKRGANILDPESVKEVITKQEWCDNRKAQVYWVYDLFLRMLGKTWEMPRIRLQQKIGFCPTEKTLNQAIAGFGKKVSIMIQLIKEVGCRSSEADHMKWSQINFDTQKITIIPEKSSNPRVEKVSKDLLGRIKTLPKINE